MNKAIKRSMSAGALLLALSLAACSSPSADSSSAGTSAVASAEQSSGTVTIEDNHGSVTVAVPPARVMATDNRTFETLSDWGIKLVAAPIDLMPAGLPYLEDSSIANLGNHREPNLEAAVAANPDLVINGQRFEQHYDQIKTLLPEAAIVELEPREGQPFDKELIRQTETLGKIFGKEAEAKKLVDDFNAAIARAKAAYSGQKVMALITSGGKINYAAPTTGRTLGPVFDILGLEPALPADGTTDHEGDEISVEAIAQANPDLLLVMDRDAAVGATEEGYVAAQQLLANSAALSGVTAIKDNAIAYVPEDTYVNEGIQTYTEYFNTIAGLLESKA